MVLDDPTARRRRSHDEVLAHAREILRRHEDGEPVRSIARALGLSRGAVRNVIEEYESAAESVALGEDVDGEYAALLGKFDPNNMHVAWYGCSEPECDGPHPATPEDVMTMDDLQLFRLTRGTPLDHPARVLYEEARASGWVHTWADGSTGY
jgi:hypothetical protein